MTNNKIFIAMSLLIFIGCTNIPIQESVSRSSDEIENKDHLGILDSKSRLLYLVENDSENIYLSIKTDYRPTQMRIMRNGVKIYINKDGKKADLRVIALKERPRTLLATILISNNFINTCICF